MTRPYAQATDAEIRDWLESDEGLREFGGLYPLGETVMLALENDPAKPLPQCPAPPFAWVAFHQNNLHGGRIKVSFLNVIRRD